MVMERSRCRWVKTSTCTWDRSRNNAKHCQGNSENFIFEIKGNPDIVVPCILPAFWWDKVCVKSQGWILNWFILCHPPGKSPKVREFENGHEKVWENGKSLGKCVLVCGVLPCVVWCECSRLSIHVSWFTQEYSCHTLWSVYKHIV